MAIIEGTSGKEARGGTEGDDTFKGSSGNDQLLWRGGNDIFEIYSGNGFDYIDRGLGSDTILAMNHYIFIGLSSVDGVETISANGKVGVYIKGDPFVSSINLSNVIS